MEQCLMYSIEVLLILDCANLDSEVLRSNGNNLALLCSAKLDIGSSEVILKQILKLLFCSLCSFFLRYNGRPDRNIHNGFYITNIFY